MTEEKEIKRMGGKAQRNSGRGILEKGDATYGPFLVDIKEFNESFAVSRKNWSKLQSDAYRAQQRQPMFWLALGSKDTEDKLRVVVLSESMFQEMYEAWKEKYEEE